MRCVSCCNPRGCDDFFGGRFARRVAAKYRKRGLDKTASRIVAFLEREGVADATVLEIGGGVGEIQLELLKRGATSAVNLELSPAYDGEARRNVVTRGIDLNALVGQRFRIGDVECFGQRLCEPCAHLERLTAQTGTLQALIHKGGLRADVLTGGEIRVGDRIAAT